MRPLRSKNLNAENAEVEEPGPGSLRAPRPPRFNRLPVWYFSKWRLVAIWKLLAALPALAADFDLVIRNGRVIDGSGNPWIYADVGVKGDRIATVRAIAKGAGAREIDAKGLFVAPGFIDGHSHAAAGLIDPKIAAAEALLTQGVTTVLLNPDGGGPTDLPRQRRAIEAARPGVNAAQMIGHNSVRASVLGQANRAPDDAELARMCELVRRGMQDGAFGFSAGPFYTPGSFSKTEEHIALARVAAGYDGFYTSHIRDESDYNVGVVGAVEEVIRVAREARLPGIVTHIKALGPRVWGKSVEIIARIDAARKEGVEVYADQYPYEASSTGLVGAIVPAWAREGGNAALIARLQQPETRASIRREMLENLERRAGPTNIMVASYRPDRSLEGKRLDAIARERLREPVDVAIDLLIAGGASIISFNMSEDDLMRLMAQPWTMTSSDGQLVVPDGSVIHPRAYGPFPRRIRRYVLEKKVTTLEEAIRSMSGLPAVVFRLRDRGLIRAGSIADLVVFDFATMADRATYEEPHQYSTGVRDVGVNGPLAWTEGKLTSARAGRVLRRTGSSNP